MFEKSSLSSNSSLLNRGALIDPEYSPINAKDLGMNLVQGEALLQEEDVPTILEEADANASQVLIDKVFDYFFVVGLDNKGLKKQEFQTSLDRKVSCTCKHQLCSLCPSY